MDNTRVHLLRCFCVVCITCAQCQVYCCLKSVSDGTLQLEKRAAAFKREVVRKSDICDILNLNKAQLVQTGLCADTFSHN